MISRGRFYFRDERGNELKLHPLNGAVHHHCGPLIGAQTRSTIYADHISGPRRITLDDFPGHRFINVFLWFPSPAKERFKLIEEPTTKMGE